MKNKVSKILLFSYIAIIFVTAVISLSGTSKALNETYVLEFRADYLVHTLLFFILMFLISLAYNINFREKIKPAILWIVAALLIAFISEGVQYWLSYRAFNINDLIANVLGVILGVIFFFVKYRSFKRSE